MLNPKISLKKTLPLLAATGVILSLSGCLSSDQRSSNNSSTESESANSFETRLKNSARVSLIVRKLDGALRPVADVLSTIESNVGRFATLNERSEISGKISQMKKLSLSMIRTELDRMKSGLIKKDADGSWSNVESVKWPFDRNSAKRRNPMSCDSSSLYLSGVSAPGKSENLSLTLMDCALDAPTTLLNATVSENLDIDADLNLGGLDQLLKPGASKGACSIKSTNVGTELECVPFTETSGGLVFEFERLSYTGTTAGDIMDFSLKISTDGSHDNDYAVRATVRKSVGQQTKVDLVRL